MLHMKPNWNQERRVFRSRVVQFLLLIVLQLVGLYTLPTWVFITMLVYGGLVTLGNAWAIHRSWGPLPTVNFFSDQLFTLFILSSSSAGSGPFVFLIYLHVMSVIIFTGQRRAIVLVSVLQTFVLGLATLLSQFGASPAPWRSFAFHCVGLFIINLFAIRVAEDLHQEAQTDPLTHALNRRSGFARLEQWLSVGNPFSLLVLDMKRFKHINDTYGHSVGDEVLQTVTRRLKDSVREDDLVIRHGGDEFLIATAGAVKPMLERLQASFAEAVQTSRGPLTIAVDIGAAQYPNEAATLADLMALADKNMYKSKSKRAHSGSQYEGILDLALFQENQQPSARHTPVPEVSEVIRDSRF
ncbi:MAG: GGDEF domain-containing protein [Trueperaceae bacterium]